MFKTSAAFDRLLEKATSHLLLEPDWNAILSICDNIRAGEVAPKYAVAAIKKKFYSDNPHVQLYALMLIESCVKNCGVLVHDEVCTKQFMEEFRDLVKHSTDESVKNKILEILQTWGMAFRNQSKYRIVTDTLNLMKAEGWKFPPVREAEAMFEADTAPAWSDGDVCHRCRVQFGMMTRQHHCRGCGQVFCSKCSSKSCPIPKFGLEKEVRVCDPCYEKFGPNDSSNQSTPKKVSPKSSDLPAEYLSSSLAQESQAPLQRNGSKTEAELREEEELQLAIALSQSEAEEKEKKKQKSNSSYSMMSTQPPASKEEKNMTVVEDEDDDLAPELVRYLNRDYWEQQQKELSKAQAETKNVGSPVAKSALKKSSKYTEREPEQHPEHHQPAVVKIEAAQTASQPAVDGRARDEDLDEFVTTLKTQVEIFVNRMKSNASRGRPIANDSSVQTLFMNTMAMHSKLLRFIQEQEDCRVYHEGLQDKITQVRDARAALDALREEERERKRREAEEAERLRQIQMQEKLEVMRQKKQEYLQYQRQLALQRMQEQEREMIFRQEQAKQQYLMQHHQLPGVMSSVPQPMFHPGMYGPMTSTAPMPMMPGAPFQPYIPPGQFSSMPGVATSVDTSTGSVMTHAPMSMTMGMSPMSAMAEPGQIPPNMPPESADAPLPSSAPMHPGSMVQPASFNMQGLASALPPYQTVSSIQQYPPQIPMTTSQAQVPTVPSAVMPQAAQQPVETQELISFD